MEAASQHDFLTGLPNRSKFMKDLEQMIDAKVPCTVMMLDIDNSRRSTTLTDIRQETKHCSRWQTA